MTASDVTQGLMFGYATDETEECMPLTVVLAHALNRRISDMRKQGALWWARPDSKTQVTEAGRCGGGAGARAGVETQRCVVIVDICSKMGRG